MQTVVVVLFALICAPIVVETMSGCHGSTGPILCNQKFYEKIIQVCDELPVEALLENPMVSRCCCSVGCQSHFLRKYLCPDTSSANH